MAVLPIRLFPDPVLRRKAATVASFDSHLAQIVRKMDETMRGQASGIGIAAPQVGISLKIALVDVSSRVPGAKRLVLINPRILQLDEERASREGCMSLPDYMANLKRYNRIKAIWQDETGRQRSGEFEGIEAICFQHEVDHLEGILFLDRVTMLKQDMIPRPKTKYRRSNEP